VKFQVENSLSSGKIFIKWKNLYQAQVENSLSIPNPGVQEREQVAARREAEADTQFELARIKAEVLPLDLMRKLEEEKNHRALRGDLVVKYSKSFQTELGEMID
jgi:hypothetical protein